ncbi:hypothetical protein SBDP1_910001 [Syntrophobacter sp. SbD1]|nr:hypothetical protein SBDP1_910001 [Syntrophobacter sp. SbD1]
MDGALVAHQPQNAVRVPMDQVWHGRQPLFRKRVLEAGGVQDLSYVRYNLFPYSVPGLLDKPLEIRIQPEGIPLNDGAQRCGVDFPFPGEGIERKHKVSERGGNIYNLFLKGKLIALFTCRSQFLRLSVTVCFTCRNRNQRPFDTD